jgi:hypothetical protein
MTASMFNPREDQMSHLRTVLAIALFSFGTADLAFARSTSTHSSYHSSFSRSYTASSHARIIGSGHRFLGSLK